LETETYIGQETHRGRDRDRHVPEFAGDQPEKLAAAIPTSNPNMRRLQINYINRLIMRRNQPTYLQNQSINHADESENENLEFWERVGAAKTEREMKGSQRSKDRAGR